jgi:predicted NUDIX family phosphoesterase
VALKDASVNYDGVRLESIPAGTAGPTDGRIFSMTDVQAEKILVVPTSRFHAIGYFQGFCGDAGRYVRELFEGPDLSFRTRGAMEDDPSFKQLIPYAIFRYTDDEGVVQVFQYTRGTGLGEGRLHRLCSVGIGGHISDVDARGAAGGEVYAEGMRRELEEEVLIDTPYTGSCVGLINDDTTPVGRVHLGVVHVFDVERPHVRPREADMLEAGFRPALQLRQELDRFETWSQIALAALFP